MPMWQENSMLGPADTFVDLESGSPSNTQPGAKTPDPATNQDKKADQSSTNNVASPKASLESTHHEVKAQIPTAPIPRPINIYSKSGFDALKVLMLAITRKNSQFDIGQIDMSCSFVVCDITLEDCPIVYVSDSFQTLTGYSRHEALGRNCRFLQSPDGKVERGSPRPYVDDGTVYSLKTNVEEKRETQISMINYRKGGKPFLNFLSIIPIPWDTDEIRYYVGFQIDLIEPPTVFVPGNIWTQL
ncbi:blue light receptor [Fusarium musae]|uniref:Blue light receptor n=1 Tax=Fusarium musae TaxID=1042133 RepID=A0A9P8DQU7_9HYPO|nr:blue light receptor [Fusarium musae]KAG9506413.1 blue light receptor [Fusarium musae]